MSLSASQGRSESCARSPAWILVTVTKTTFVVVPPDEGEAEDRDLLFRRGRKLIDVCQITDVWENEDGLTIIGLPTEGNLMVHTITVAEPLDAVCFALDCGNADRAR